MQHRRPGCTHEICSSCQSCLHCRFFFFCGVKGQLLWVLQIRFCLITGGEWSYSKNNMILLFFFKAVDLICLHVVDANVRCDGSVSRSVFTTRKLHGEQHTVKTTYWFEVADTVSAPHEPCHFEVWIPLTHFWHADHRPCSALWHPPPQILLTSCQKIQTRLKVVLCTFSDWFQLGSPVGPFSVSDTKMETLMWTRFCRN